MEIKIIKTGLGDNFTSVSEKAKSLATTKQIIQFDFNGITCKVSTKTNLKNLLRDYENSFIMNWKEIGTVCKDKYDTKTKNEIKKRKLAQEKNWEAQKKESQLKEKQEMELCEKNVSGIKIELKDEDRWNKFVEINNDPYGGTCVKYAELWARLMQNQISKGIKIQDCAEKTSFELGFLGISGFMYGAAVSMLSECWIHGEDLRKWHNKDYGHEGEGVVNPAIITIGGK